MSVRESVMRRMQDARDTERDNAVRARNDVMIFCSEMDRLAAQIHLWLDGSAIEVETLTLSHRDDSISKMPGAGADRYDVAAVRLKNHAHRAEILPVGVYGFGARGSASLTITSNQRAPASEAFLLRLDRETSRWSVRRDEHAAPAAEPLNKQTFLRVIAALS